MPYPSCITTCRRPRLPNHRNFVTFCPIEQKKFLPPSLKYHQLPALTCDSVGQGCGRNSFEALPTGTAVAHATLKSATRITHHTFAPLGLEKSAGGWNLPTDQTGEDKHLARQLLHTGAYCDIKNGNFPFSSGWKISSIPK